MRGLNASEDRATESEHSSFPRDCKLTEVGQANPVLCPAALALYLRLLHRGRVLVTHGTNLHSTLPFPVALLEELGHDTVSPLSIQLQRLGGVAEVRTVHHVPEDLVNAGSVRDQAEPQFGGPLTVLPVL